MLRHGWKLAVCGVLVCCGLAQAQSPGPIYTFAGTGNTRDWSRAGTSFTVLSNTTPGFLTVTEVGDEFEPGNPDLAYFGQNHVFFDGFNRVRESGFSAGGLDVTGLDFLEIDLQHNGAGNVDVQFFVQVGYDGEVYTWADLPDTSVAPNTLTTLQFPLSAITPAQRTYIRAIGVDVRDHAALGYLTWQVGELRSVGTPLTTRTLASHEVGSSDNGLNGAYANFGLDAIVGNNGEQNQTGLSFNSTGPGSLQWVDSGGAGTPADPSGGAVSWGNGTEFFNQNSFYERPVDVSNYTTATIRMSATDVVPGGGGNVGVNAFFQTNNYSAHQTAGSFQVPVDGLFHEFTVPLTALTNLNLVDAWGLDLNAHANDVQLNVDFVRFDMTAPGLEGDYNKDGSVDAADYIGWRKAPELFGGTPGGYNTWVENFGEMEAGSGGDAVPEPSSVLLAFAALAFVATTGRLRVA